MKFLPLLHSLLLVELFILPFTTFTAPFSDYEDSFSDYGEDDSDEPRATTLCKFERTQEVYKECSQVLSSASKEKLSSNKNNNIYRANDIPFHNGDWVQEPGRAPLMPFDDTDMPKNSSINNQSLLKLASFWLMGVDFRHQAENSISLCGLLYIGITRNRTLPYTPDRWKPWFYHRPGYSNLIIPFEGLYAESEENGGERLMCLLGRSYSPFSGVFASPSPWQELSEYGCKHKQAYPFEEDDRIMLVLRYPQRFTLTSRAILGEMRSLNQKKNPKYFDPVKIYSRLSYDSKYFFGSKQLVSRACEPYPYDDKLIGDHGIQVFRGLQYCKVFNGFGSEVFDLFMVSNCDDGTAKHYNKLGPFMRTGTSLDDLRLVMTDLRCVSGDHLNKDTTAKVSAVFKAISSGEDQLSLGTRTGFSGMTISAEGIWNSSTGQLCMVGCVGLETDSDGCNTRICLYLPVKFTITQRSIVIGTISSVENADSQSPPLLFKKELLPLDLWNRYSEYSNSHLSYKYSKVEQASELLKRNGFSQLGTLIKTLFFFTYPTVDDSSNLTSLSALSDQLSLDVLAFPDCFLNSRAHKIYLKFEVLSLGKLFGRYWSFMKHSCKGEDTEFHVNSDSRDQNLPLNISGHLTLRSSSSSTTISKLFLEGIYDRLQGKMYLIGCRDVLNAQKFMHNDDMKLENEMDCLVQVRIEYSSKATRWLVNPTAKIFIASQRTLKDPLYFSPIRLCTSLVLYRENSEEIVFRKNFEALLRVLMLLASIACLLSQWLYIRKKNEFTPFMSLTMLGVQALGFALPLVADTAIFFKWKEYEYPKSRSLRSWKSLRFQMLDCVMKFLLLSAFVLTLRLLHKVWEFRQLTDKPKTMKHNVGDKRVLLSTLTIHMVGFLVVLITHSKKTTTEIAYWVTALEEYVGLVQDFFLIPQMIGNLIWQVQVRPLSGVYYIGFTVSKLVLHGYDYLRDPVFSPYFHKYDSNASTQFFSKSEEVMIMTIVAVLAIVVHVQQKYWHFNKLV